MYRIMMKAGRTWKMGLVDYKTAEEVMERVIELESIGHKCKVVNNITGDKIANWKKGIA